jgi:hypothetical protein
VRIEKNEGGSALAVMANAQGSKGFSQERIVSGSSKEAGVTTIKMEDIVSSNNAIWASITWTVQGLDASQNPLGGECVVGARLVSPIVLDLANIGAFEGVSAADSGVKFDFAANGRISQSGWVKPTMGLLAMDKNENGVTEKGELRSLASLQIQNLGVLYSPSHRHGNRESLDNDVRYEARYWGPARCGTEGCLSFDVYFSTLQSLASNGR